MDKTMENEVAVVPWGQPSFLQHLSKEAKTPP